MTSQIANWEKNYVLKAPFSGKITFTRFWNNNQNVKIGDAVFNVVPDDFSYYIGRIQLPVKNSGKVMTGQKVIIKLDNFPYTEFGMLKSYISSVSLVSDDNFFFAEVQLPSKLITSYGKKLTTIKEMKSTAEIITKDYRLLYRLIYPLKALIDKNNSE